jgi:hypothetical protein
VGTGVRPSCSSVLFQGLNIWESSKHVRRGRDWDDGVILILSKSKSHPAGDDENRKSGKAILKFKFRPI